MKKLFVGVIGTALLTLSLAFIVMLLAGDIYPLSYAQSIHIMLIAYVLAVFTREAK
jgi:hypothetical protein